MATTYILISSVTVGSGGAADMEFTSIPATYTDLVVKLSLRSSDDNTITKFQFNNDTSTANYSQRRLYGSGSTVASDTNTALGYFSPIAVTKSSYTASTFSNVELYIPNYTSSNNKSVSFDAVTENNATESWATFTAGLWSQTSAITSIKILPNTTNLAQYSTAYLYGISNA
jgi:hypothetical protein